VRFKFFYLLAALLFIAPVLRAEETLEDADKHFAAGEFEKARAIYHAQAQGAGHPAAFYYNLGTAALRAGAAGEAYVALRRAALASPFDPDTKVNLQIARAKLPAGPASIRPASWISWWPDALRWIPWQAWACAGLLALIPLLLGAKSALLPWHYTMGFAALILLLGASLTGWQSRVGTAGIIQATKIFSGPGKSYPEITSIDSGSLVSLEESRDNWFKIRYLDSRLQETVGWVEAPTALKLDGGI
jgi:hypothetical protein